MFLSYSSWNFTSSSYTFPKGLCVRWSLGFREERKYLCDGERIFCSLLGNLQKSMDERKHGGQELAVNCNMTLTCKSPISPSYKLSQDSSSHVCLHASFTLFLMCENVCASSWGWCDVERGNPGINQRPRMKTQYNYKQQESWRRVKVREGTFTDPGIWGHSRQSYLYPKG